MNNGPIGVFDSGVGGLTVARELMRRLPREKLLYVADTGRLPYGTRPAAEVEAFTLQIIRFLQEKGAKLVVIACNTATAAGLEAARRAFTIPILGVIEPGARLAAEKTRNGKIGVTATPGTIASGAYVRAIKKINPALEVYGEPCPEFVPLVEKGVQDVGEARRTAEKCLHPLLEKGIDTLVLGCTHFPFLADIIQTVVGERVALVDPAVGTVAQVEEILREREMEAALDRPEHRFYTSGDPETFKTVGSILLGRPIEQVEKIIWQDQKGR